MNTRHSRERGNPVVLLLLTLVLPLLFSMNVGAQGSPTAPVAAAGPGGKPVTIDGALQFDFTSRINARTYRLFVYRPPALDASLNAPVLYVLDGNAYFAAGSDLLRRMVEQGIIGAGVLVAIGYPESEAEIWQARRSHDLTPSQSIEANVLQQTGGAELFLRVIEEEIKPFIAARYNVDAARQALFGHSYGGLFVLHTLFTKPESFPAYISSSPSIWYNESEVLAHEAAFSERARSGEIRARLLLTSAADEDLAESPERMVGNASELAVRLRELDAENVGIERVIFEGEDHFTVPFVALNRALRFALLPN
jgi:predicted alpha/beta superfamily hydrolase